MPLNPRATMSSMSARQPSAMGKAAPKGMSLSLAMADAQALILPTCVGLVAMERTTLLSMPCASI